MMNWTLYQFTVMDPFGQPIGMFSTVGGAGMFEQGQSIPFGAEPAQFYITVKCYQLGEGVSVNG